MPVEMQQVLSSHIMSVGYDEDTQELHVHYAPSLKNPRGTRGFYAGIDPDTAAAILGAESIGSAIHQHIKSQKIPFQEPEAG